MSFYYWLLDSEFWILAPGGFFIKYRTLGKSGVEVSVLGFGCMRLPIQRGAESEADIFNPEKPVDVHEATRMVEYAVNHGVNCFDTAYGYHGGQSETFLGKAIAPYRKDVLIASKLPVWMVQSADDFDRILDEQLQRLDMEYLDFYLLHGLARHLWEPAREMGALKFLDRILADGRVKHVGFSFHDDIKIFKEIVDSYEWEMYQIQYNYYDENYQAGKEGLKYAAERNIGVIAMEPLRGGKIVDPIPDKIQEVWDSAPVRRSAVEWAFRWLWDQPDVTMALSGMSNMAQVFQNAECRTQNWIKILITTEQDLHQASLTGIEGIQGIGKTCNRASVYRGKSTNEGINRL
ncbi:MAG: aldo/keto reductase [bacterium]|nr:aldo/keto reductase [bacterium]MDT8366747.1 aldo/keto reductase [bacterium]